MLGFRIFKHLSLIYAFLSFLFQRAKSRQEARQNALMIPKRHFIGLTRVVRVTIRQFGSPVRLKHVMKKITRKDNTKTATSPYLAGKPLRWGPQILCLRNLTDLVTCAKNYEFDRPGVSSRQVPKKLPLPFEMSIAHTHCIALPRWYVLWTDPIRLLSHGNKSTNAEENHRPLC